MKAFTNANARDVSACGHAAQAGARQGEPHVAIAGGGSDLLGMVKERLVTPDVLVNLKTIKASIR